jgi:hypothetical protein
LLWELADYLGWRGDRALLCREGCEGLQEVCVAVVLACGGLREGLLGGGEISGEVRAVATIGAPRGEQGYGQDCRDQDFSDAKI